MSIIYWAVSIVLYVLAILTALVTVGGVMTVIDAGGIDNAGEDGFYTALFAVFTAVFFIAACLIAKAALTA